MIFARRIREHNLEDIFVRDVSIINNHKFSSGLRRDPILFSYGCYAIIMFIFMFSIYHIFHNYVPIKSEVQLLLKYFPLNRWFGMFYVFNSVMFSEKCAKGPKLI